MKTEKDDIAIQFSMPTAVRETASRYIRRPIDVLPEVGELAKAVQETVVVLDLNVKNRVIAKRLVTVGLADASLIHPREVFRGAVANSASAIIVCHNHPSGDNNPSPEDLRVTRQLVESGKILGIQVVDHVIIGTDEATGEASWRSLREDGSVTFE